MTKLSPFAATFVAATTIAALEVIGHSLLHMQALQIGEFLLLLLISVVASRLKLKLPGMDSNMSVNLPFLVLAVIRLSLFEALMVALVSTAVQSVPNHRELWQPVKVLFNINTMVVAAGVGTLVFRSEFLVKPAQSFGALPLVLTGCAFFLVNTLAVALIIAVTENKNVFKNWGSICRLSFPYYLECTGLTSIIQTVSRHVEWQVPLAVLPLMVASYWCYKLYFGQASQALNTVSSPGNGGTKVQST
jgi:hypothetical protein